jgi:tetratricopeptide (TPR) repeat protein
VSPAPPDPRDRIEPVSDWLQELEFGDRPASSPPAWRDRRHWRWVIAIMLLLVVALVALREPLAQRMWPDTRLQRLLQQGELALRQGHLSATDGSGARQRFEAAHALDSDRGEAREGLQRVGEAALQQARQALQADRLEQARQALSLALELQVPRTQSDAVARELREREADGAGIDSLLAQADAAHRAGRLTGADDAALPLYQRVLALQPSLTAALEGREDVISDLLAQARRVLQDERLIEGATQVADARRYDPGHVDLPDSQALLTRALERRLQAAARDLRRGRLDAALTGYREVLAVAPDDGAARQGIEQVAAAYAGQAARFAGDYDFARAEALLQQALVLAPQQPTVTQAQQALENARRSRARLASPLSPARRDQQVERLLADIRAAESRGEWILPPGDSAFDKLRAAQALLPDDRRVQRAGERLAPSTQACFEQELQDNRIARARACFDAWQALAPGHPRLADARRRLAQKWVAVGTEQLGAGDVGFAVRALEQARTLDADAPGVDEFAERVRSAVASTR